MWLGNHYKASQLKRVLSLYEWKQHKPWCDDECSQYLYQRKQSEMQWVQDPNQSNADNLNDVRHETSRHSGTKRRNI